MRKNKKIERKKYFYLLDLVGLISNFLSFHPSDKKKEKEFYSENVSTIFPSFLSIYIVDFDISN